MDRVGADRSPVSRTQIVAVGLLALAAAIAVIAIQRNIFPFFSGDHDEVVYQFQARMLLDGHLTLSPAQQLPFFRPWLSGEHDGRLVMAFPWGWPAILAASQALTTSMLPAVAGAAILATVAAYLFTRELLGDHPRALLAAALVMLSPFTLVLGGTYLNYVFVVGVELLFGWLLLLGLRTGRTGLLVAAGIAWGAVFFTRPYDAVLFALPFGVWFLATFRRHALVRPVVALALGALPFVGAVLAMNWITSGAPLAFSTTVQSHGAARFLWGYRSIAGDIRGIDFTLSKAWKSLGDNLRAVPSWLLGTYFLLALAIVGAVVLARRAAGRLGLLLGMLVVFPLGYLAWFASALTVPGAQDGIGPHYYLPMVVPVAILAAEAVVGGVERLRARSTAWTGVAIGAVAVAVVALTAVALPPKLDDKRYQRDVERAYTDKLDEQLAGRTRPAIMILEPVGAPYVMAEHVVLRNPPDLDADVLYALDRGAATTDLVRAHPDRDVYELVRFIAADGDIFAPELRAEKVTVTSAPEITIRTTITNPSGAPVVAAYLTVGNRGIESVVLDEASRPGSTYTIMWRISADGTVTWSLDDGTTFTRASADAVAAGKLTVGVSFGADGSHIGVERRELRFDYRRANGAVDVIRPGQPWQHLGPPFDHWLPIDVTRFLSVTVPPR